LLSILGSSSKMKIYIRRFEYGPNYTIGRLFVDGEYQCYTLEDKVRDTKVFGETAIPAGKYKVVIDYSPRFKRELPHILNVPGFEGVRIHPGNTPEDTEGCILVGKTWAGTNFIGQSRKAFEELFEKMKAAVAAKEEIELEIENA